MTDKQHRSRPVSSISGRLPADGTPVKMNLRGSRVADVRLLPDNDIDGAGHHWILPGLLDMQVNGYGGHDLNAEDVEAATVIAMVQALWKQGVALCCPTVITGSPDRMRRSLTAVAEACRRDRDVDASVVGIHVEGPYISPADGPRGAHPPQYVRRPDWAEFCGWQRAAGGRIRLLTLAPEIDGALAFTERLVAAGVAVAIGHTEADRGHVHAAVAAGATVSTHLGNGTHATVPRLHNTIWEQLAADDLYASIIVDGHHLPPSVVTSFYRTKGTERLILVSDASPWAGLPPGRYRGFHGEVDLLPNGRIQMTDAPYLAGSSANLLDCINMMRSMTGADLVEVAQMAAYRPERALGLSGRTGTFSPGGAATFSVLEEVDGTLQPVATIVLGRAVWHRADSAVSEVIEFGE